MADTLSPTYDTSRFGKKVLRLDRVVKRFGDNVVLDHISFDVHQHETVALLGPSGSGKSTLMKCINLLEQVNDGQIWLGDTDITDPRINEDKTRARIGVVFQPHRYTRTQALLDDFARAFDQADLLVVTEVFSAGEMPIPGVSGRVLAARVRELGGTVQTLSIDRRKDVIAYLCDNCRAGDLLITQGAGDVTSIGPDFIAAMREREEAQA